MVLLVRSSVGSLRRHRGTRAALMGCARPPACDRRDHDTDSLATAPQRTTTPSLAVAVGHADGLVYCRMFTARAITSATVETETRDCAIIASLAQRLRGSTSVGLNAVALVNDT